MRISVIGRRDRLRPALRRAVERAEAATDRAAAASTCGSPSTTRPATPSCARRPRYAPPPARSRRRARPSPACSGDACHAGEPVPDVDLLIRTGGEKRLSDFLLWECAYAELVFLDRRWPDFERRRPAPRAVAEFQGRERRFGLVPA